MTEVMQLYKEENIWKKILPVILREVKLSDPLVRLSYVNYWQEKSKILDSSLEGIDLINATDAHMMLRTFEKLGVMYDSETKDLVFEKQLDINCL